MDGPRFDALARTLGDRRRVLAGGVALAALAGFPAPADGGKRRKRSRKKPCPPCRARRKGKCRKPLADGTPCAGGVCQDGACVAQCTGLNCGGTCPPCGNGQPCVQATDCLSFRCDEGLCRPCLNGSQCPSGCECEGTNNVCVTLKQQVDACDECPPGTRCLDALFKSCVTPCEVN